MSYQDSERPRRSERARAALNKLERVYLSAIRAIALIAATVLVIYALWLSASGIYKSSRDVSSVSEAPAVVSPEEVAAIDLRKLAKTTTAASLDPLSDEKRYYAEFTNRYHALFRANFERFKKPDDRPLEKKAFDQKYLRTGERLEAIKEGSANFEQDRADLESLFTTMKAVAADQRTIDRLRAYKGAKKVRVARTESGTREETYCSYYGYYINECISYDTRTVPYRRTIEEMKLPAGIVSHVDLFGAYQDRYLSMLSDKRQLNAAEADSQREEIIADNANGKARLWSALSVIGGFLILMFLFLLIALERHQRKIAASVPEAT